MINDILTIPGVEEIRLIPPSRVTNKAALGAGFRGVIFVSTPEVIGHLDAAGHRLRLNTTRKDLLNGDYAGVHIGNEYYLVCDVAAA